MKPDTELKPCPFCGDLPTLDSEFPVAYHPRNSCLLSSYTIDTTDERWNLRSSPAGYERGLEDAAKLVILEAEKCEEGSTADANGWPAAFLVIARKIRALKGQCHSEALAPAGGSTLDTRPGWVSVKERLPEVSAWQWVETWHGDSCSFSVARHHVGDKLPTGITYWRFIDPPAPAASDDCVDGFCHVAEARGEHYRCQGKCAYAEGA